MTLMHFGKELEQVMAHSKHCPQGGSTKLDKEVKRDGLYTVLVFRCHDSGLNINVETQPSKKNWREAQVNQYSCCMGYDEHWRRSCKNGRVIFGPTRACTEQKSFLKAENFISDKWKETLRK